MKPEAEVDELCQLIRRIFEDGDEELKITAAVTIQAWSLILNQDEPV